MRMYCNALDKEELLTLDHLSKHRLLTEMSEHDVPIVW